MINADLHIHTTYSGDATNQPKTIVEQLNAHPTIKVLAVTDHNTFEGCRKVQELASSYQDILVIPGVEVSAVEGELILLGVTELPPKPWKAEDVIEFAKTNGGVTVAPHPYRGYGLGDLTRRLNVDAIEVLNGITDFDLNRRAEELAKTKGLPGVAGSDAHENQELWTVCTQVQASLDVDAILKAIKRGAVRTTLTLKSIHF